MTSVPDRREAVAHGARLKRACAELGIGYNTYRRWRRSSGDARPHAQRPTPANALTQIERDQVLAVTHRPEFGSLLPGQIVPRLLDEEGLYLASESTFYRVMRSAGEQHRRGRAAPPSQPGPPRRHQATGPNQIWSWGVTYMPMRIRGHFYYLYLIIRNLTLIVLSIKNRLIQSIKTILGGLFCLELVPELSLSAGSLLYFLD